MRRGRNLFTKDKKEKKPIGTVTLSTRAHSRFWKLHRSLAGNSLICVTLNVQAASVGLGAAHRGHAAVIDRLGSRMVSFQLCEGFILMCGAISSNRHAPIGIRNHCDCSRDLAAGKNFTRLVEVTPHLRKVPEVNFGPLIHCTLGGIIFLPATPSPCNTRSLVRCQPCVADLNRTNQRCESSVHTPGSTASHTQHLR
jgi:hypothetical protein